MSYSDSTLAYCHLVGNSSYWVGHSLLNMGRATPKLVLFPDLRLTFPGTYTANTHPLSLVTFDVESSLLIGLIRFYEAEHENTLYQVITDFNQRNVDKQCLFVVILIIMWLVFALNNYFVFKLKKCWQTMFICYFNYYVIGFCINAAILNYILNCIF